VYRHGILSSLLGKIPIGVVMDVPAQMSLSYGPILSISLPITVPLWLSSLHKARLDAMPAHCSKGLVSDNCLPFGSKQK